MKKLIFTFAMLLSLFAAAEVKPLKVLMITGGGWHDYKKQAPLLKATIESKINAIVTIKWTSTKEHKVGPRDNKMPQIFKEDFAKGYDVVFHNHCHIGFKDDVQINKVIDNHIKNKAGVILTHGSFHTFRDTSAWDRLCGVKSTNHGQRAPIKVEVVNSSHPVTKALGVGGWTTKEGELYRTELNEKTTSLAKGTTLEGKPHTQSCVFSQELEGIKVLGTTLGHHVSTMEQKEFGQMISLAVLWTAGKLDKDGKAAKGYLKEK